MKPSPSEKKAAAGPAVLRFKAKLLRQADAGKTEFGLALKLPDSISREFPPDGLAQVEGTINGHPFRAPLDADADGGHLLRVNKAMSAGAKAEAGDTVQLAILGPEPESKPPEDLRAALAASPAAMTLWKQLTPFLRRDWIRWVEGAKKAETRARRVTRTIEQLAEGKRRACCVNVYEYMLCRVNEN